MHGSGVIRLAKIYRAPTDYRQVRLVAHQPSLRFRFSRVSFSFHPIQGKVRHAAHSEGLFIARCVYRAICLTFLLVFLSSSQLRRPIPILGLRSLPETRHVDSVSLHLRNVPLIRF